MDYGFIDYNGNAWSNASVDTYNLIDAEVSKRLKLNPAYGSLARTELEFYLDQRHKTFVQLSEINGAKP
ncbi:MAG: hypothetical protein WCP55_15985 [Lentisphaerota bacterium]